MILSRKLDSQLRACIDLIHQYNPLSSRQLGRVQQRGFRRAFLKTVEQRGYAFLAGYRFSFQQLRDLNNRSFPAVLPAYSRLTMSRNRPAIFVGHRFTPGVTGPLRHNLLTILRPYGVRLLYADSDLPNGDLFGRILKQIRESAFCIFDDRETEVRPNVFIELGAAIALAKPYLYLSYQNKRTVRLGNRREPISVPTDLAGILFVGYRDYEQLSLQLATRLPEFLLHRKLATRRI